MATLSYDFEGDTIGTVPDGWSFLYQTGSGGATVQDVSGDQVFEFNPGNLETITCINDDAGSVNDVIVSGEFSRSSSQTDTSIWIRHSGDANPANVDGYWFTIRDSGSQLYTITNGAVANTIGTDATVATGGVSYNFRFEATGTTIRAWWGSGAWPSTWLISGTEATYSSGSVVLYSSYGSRFDDIAIESDDITSGVDVTPTLGTLSVAGYDPSVHVSSGLEPGLGTITIEGHDPQVNFGVNVVPKSVDDLTAGVLQIQGYNPTVTLTDSLQPTLGTIEVTGYDPTVIAPTGVAAGLGTLEVTGYNPTVTATSSTLVNLYFKYKDASGIVRTVQFWRRPLVTSVSTTYTAQNIEEIIAADASGGAFTITLPSAVDREGYVYVIKKTDSSSNAVKVDGLAAQTIDGAADFDLEFEDEVITVVSDNANWLII